MNEKQGGMKACRLVPLKALRLRPGTIWNPVLTVNDERIELPAEPTSGSCRRSSRAAPFTGPRPNHSPAMPGH